MSVTIYGIKNCDTMKKAFDWLNENHVKYQFHNYKTEGMSSEKAEEWLSQENPEILINTKGTTFRAFPEEHRADYKSANTAKKMMLENQSVIKRPVLEINGKVAAVGFNPEVYAHFFAKD